MNTFTKKLKVPDAPRRGKGASSKSWLVPLALKLGLIAALIFTAVNLRISYSAKEEDLNRESSRIKMRIHRLNREIANLKIRKENLSSWPCISSKIGAYNLALRPPEPDQVRRIALGRDSAERGAVKVQVAEKRGKLQLTQR